MFGQLTCSKGLVRCRVISGAKPQVTPMNAIIHNSMFACIYGEYVSFFLPVRSCIQSSGGPRKGASFVIYIAIAYIKLARILCHCIYTHTVIQIFAATDLTGQCCTDEKQRLHSLSNREYIVLKDHPRSSHTLLCSACMLYFELFAACQTISDSC